MTIDIATALDCLGIDRRHVRIEDAGDGLGPRIVKWAVPNMAQPTTEDLIAALTGDLAIRNSRERKTATIRAEGAKRLRTLGPYLPEERDSWATQHAEAAAFRADANVPTPLIDAIVAARQIPKETLVGYIEKNAILYRVAAGNILGIQQRLLDQVWAATTVEEIDAINWSE